jgi:hypothetical protein
MITDEQLQVMADDAAGDIVNDLIKQGCVLGTSRFRSRQLIRRILMDFGEAVRKGEYIERWKPDQ